MRRLITLPSASCRPFFFLCLLHANIRLTEATIQVLRFGHYDGGSSVTGYQHRFVYTHSTRPKTIPRQQPPSPRRTRARLPRQTRVATPFFEAEPHLVLFNEGKRGIIQQQDANQQHNRTPHTTP